MRSPPLRNEATGRPRADAAREESPVEGKGGLLSLVFRVEIGDAVFAIEHPDHDSEEHRDHWHWACSSPTYAVGLTSALSGGGERQRADRPVHSAVSHPR